MFTKVGGADVRVGVGFGAGGGVCVGGGVCAGGGVCVVGGVCVGVCPVVGVCVDTGSCARAQAVTLSTMATAIATILIRLFIKQTPHVVVSASRESRPRLGSLWRKVLVS
jgi:hypothetical protein